MEALDSASLTPSSPAKMSTCEKITSELLKFSKDVLGVNSPINDDRISIFEKKNDLKLPNDFKQFITRINGFSLFANKVYGFDEGITESIENVYHFEHFEVSYPQPLYLVPFCNDGRGNFYCLDTSKTIESEKCSIVFWVSNYEYTDGDLPEVVNDNFLEWIKEVTIEWTLEEYNYDGSEK